MQSKDEPLRLAFLTALEVPPKGYVGGLLVTNHLGRPLEFQCTTPLRPNRTQEILYGPTLVPFVQAELIGRTLVERVSVRPQLVLVEDPDLLELRRHVDVPVACLLAPDAARRPTATNGSRRDDDDRDPHESSAAGPTLTLGRCVVRFHADFPDDAARLTGPSRAIPPTADPSEPFERVREALRETLAPGAVA